MKKELAKNGLIKMFSGLFIMGVFLFVPAKTLKYPGACRMLAILFVPMLILGVVLFFLNPQLLEKRLKAKESQQQQKGVILLSAVMFIGSFVLCGLDYRFGWTTVPHWLIITGCIIFLLSYAGFAELLRENEYLARTVEIQENQKVISTGMYGIVRHPMYAVIIFLFLSMPLVIGSFAGLVPLLLLPLILVKRILNEEKVLMEGLPGYTEYMQKVRYRLVPFIW